MTRDSDAAVSRIMTAFPGSRIVWRLDDVKLEEAKAIGQLRAARGFDPEEKAMMLCAPGLDEAGGGAGQGSVTDSPRGERLVAVVAAEALLSPLSWGTSVRDVLCSNGPVVCVGDRAIRMLYPRILDFTTAGALWGRWLLWGNRKYVMCVPDSEGMKVGGRGRKVAVRIALGQIHHMPEIAHGEIGMWCVVCAAPSKATTKTGHGYCQAHEKDLTKRDAMLESRARVLVTDKGEAIVVQERTIWDGEGDE